MKQSLTWLAIALLLSLPVLASDTTDTEQSTEYRPFFYAQKYAPPHLSAEWKDFYEQFQPFWDVPLPNDIEGWRELDRQKQAMFIERDKDLPLTHGVELHEQSFNGVRVVKLVPPQLRNPKQALVYFNGGAWSSNGPESTWVDTVPVAAALGLPVYAVDYSKAPEVSIYDIIDEGVSVFKYLVDEEKYEIDQLGIYGCSAGGHLALTVSNALRHEGIGIPGAAVARSPMVDFTLTNDTWITLERHDPLISTEAYVRKILPILGIKNFRDPRISPQHDPALNQGMPPTLFQTGGKEVLLGDSLVMYQALEAAGQTAKLDVYDGMVHCFPMIFPDTKEAKTANAKQAAWFKLHLGLE